jgi:hypothetical protein
LLLVSQRPLWVFSFLTPRRLEHFRQVDAAFVPSSRPFNKLRMTER